MGGAGWAALQLLENEGRKNEIPSQWRHLQTHPTHYDHTTLHLLTPQLGTALPAPLTG
jgi:hypothetical protein